jgi:CheY-like chemotaxis protein
MQGKIELRKEPVEVATVIARAVETAQPGIDAQGHELAISLPPEPVWVEGDPIRLAQVVSNLLNNSAKYMEEDGHIWLTAKPEGQELVLRVRDNGIGIAPEIVPQIFEPFVQAEHGLSRAQGGLGIGLTLVNRLVKMHGGSVTAYSEGVGKGSEFTVRLPALPETPAAARDPKKEAEEPSPLPCRRILVVDDNVDAAESLATVLRLQGQYVREAHDGAAALQVARDYRPEVVFLDIGMPRMDGYEVARRLRQEPGMEGTVVVALTGWGQEEDRRRSQEAGFDHHFVKPVEPIFLSEFLASIHKEAVNRGAMSSNQ